MEKLEDLEREEKEIEKELLPMFKNAQDGLRSLPESYKKDDVAIEVSESANRLMNRYAYINQKKWAISTGRSFNEQEWHPLDKVYGYSIRVVPDHAMDGKSARVVYEPPLKPHSIVLQPDD